MNVSEKIEYLRCERGISLTHLNKVIGAYRGKITDVKNGKSSFSDAEISILAHELHTTTDYLLGNTDDPTPAGKEKKADSPKGTDFKPTEKDWERAIENMSKEQMRIVMDMLMKKYVEE